MLWNSCITNSKLSRTDKDYFCLHSAICCILITKVLFEKTEKYRVESNNHSIFEYSKTQELSQDCLKFSTVVGTDVWSEGSCFFVLKWHLKLFKRYPNLFKWYLNLFGCVFILLCFCMSFVSWEVFLFHEVFFLLILRYFSRMMI